MYWRQPSEKFVPAGSLARSLAGQGSAPARIRWYSCGKRIACHRILAPGLVRIPSAGSAYVEALRSAKVLSRDEREQRIRKELMRLSVP